MIQTLVRLLTSRLLYRICLGVSVIIISNYVIADKALADSFSVAASLANIAMVISDVGMNMVIMRGSAKDPKNNLAKYYGTGIALETISWIFFLALVLVGYASFNGLTPLFWLLLGLGLSQAFVQYRSVIRSAYRILDHKEWVTFLEVLDGLGKIIGVYLITRLIPNVHDGVFWIVAVYAITSVIFVTLYALHSFKLIRPFIVKQLAKPMLLEGFWFSMQTLAISIYFEVDKLILRFYQTTPWVHIPAGDIAKYNAAANLVVFFLIFPRLGLQIITPRLYASVGDNMERYRRIIRISYRYLGAFGIGLGTGLIVLAEEILDLLYKPELVQGTVPAMQLFGVFLIIRFAGITSSQVYATTQHQPWRTKLESLSILFNIVLDLILIPFYGFLGGAIATLITEILFQGIFYWESQKYMKESIWPTLIKLLPAVAAGIMMGLAVWAGKQWLWFWLLPVLGAALYAGLLYIFKFLQPADLRLLKGQTQPH